MAVKKNNNKKDTEDNYKKLSEELKLKLQKSEAKIVELNEKYKKVVDIQKKKIEDKYKKIIENLEKKKSITDKASNANNAEISTLQKRLEKLEKINQKLEEEKRKIEAKNEELTLKAKEAVKKQNNTESKTAKTDKETIKEIKILKDKLLASEEEKKELKVKLKEAISELKNSKKTASSQSSKEDQYREQLLASEEEKKDLKQQLKELTAELKNSKKTVSSQSSKEDQYREQLLASEEEKKELKQKLKELTAELKNAQKGMAKSPKEDQYKEQLSASEEEKKELKQKLKELTTELKSSQKNTNKLSKEDKDQYKENVKILKQIEKESKALEKKHELIKKEEEKLKEIRGDIKSSAKDIASTMKKSYIMDDDDEKSESKEATNPFSVMDSATEEGITKLATLMCAAMDDYREQKEKEKEKEKAESENNINIEHEIEPEVRPIISEGEDRLNKASEQLEELVESRLEDADSIKDDNLGKRPFTIIEKIENSRIEINDGYSPPSGGQPIVAPPEGTAAPQQAAPQGQQPNITVKVEAPKETAKLSKPETQLKPASETPTMRMKLLDDIDDYEKKLVITYGFDNMPENTYYSKYKKILRNAARISLFGNLQEGLEMFKLIREQNIPDEYKQMIDKNIQDITYYLRGLHRVRME